MSKSRLNSLQNSLNRKDPELITKYNKQLLEQLNLGFTEKVQNLDHHENSRPLTYPYTDINDTSSLMPSHFLCGFCLLTLPDTNAKENETYPDYIPSETSRKALTKRAQYQKTLINTFWTRWKTEYLTSQREHHTCRKRILNKKAVAIGDVVLIHDNTPRNQWKIGVVTSVHTGKDGLVRSVSLRVPSGKELSRPIEKLYP